MSTAIETDLYGVVEDAAAHLYVWALKDIPQDLRDALADAAERETSVTGRRVLEGRALGAGLKRLVDLRRVEREVLADAAGVDRDARVLADEVVLLVGDGDVLDDRVQDALPRHRGLAVPRRSQSVA